MKTILITGATGYIGSHTCAVLIDAGYNVIGLDNFSNSSPGVLECIEKLTNKKLNFVEGDLRDIPLLQGLFNDNNVDAVIHFAALKSVKESVENPITYYETNLESLFKLTKTMIKFNVKKLVFSSSATVYGETSILPIKETHPLKAISPYGQTKLMGELFLNDLRKSDQDWSVGILRYFNPVGAHESGLIGENPQGMPNNIMPTLAKVARGNLPKLFIYGGDYATKDGTGVRDYIHVMDLANGHLKSIEKLLKDDQSFTLNLGTGKGVSVLEILKAYEKASGKTIPYKVIGRRAGDVESCYASPSKAFKLLGWIAERRLHDMCRDSWNWECKNSDFIH